MTGRRTSCKPATHIIMYLEHFGLREYPFTLTPDTSYFLAARHYQAALNTLLVATHTGEPFVKITGEIGTGKTLLCRHYLACIEQLNSDETAPDIVTAFIPNPCLTPQSLLLAMAAELGIDLPADCAQHVALKMISDMLLKLAQGGQRVVLCFDEVQAMPVETLESLRLLTNLETEKQKLLQIVLFGQPELDEKLKRNDLRQLNQRITFHYRLAGMDQTETKQYLMHRLQTAGYRGAPLFTDAATRVMYKISGGVPRLVNILAHKALMASFGAGETFVDVKQIKAAARDTESVRLPPRFGWRQVVPVVLFALLGIGTWLLFRIVPR